MTDITIKTFLPDGTMSGEMTMPIDNVLSMSKISVFAKLCRESDDRAGTAAIDAIKSAIIAKIAECRDADGKFKNDRAKQDAEKLEKKLSIVYPEFKPTARKIKTIKKNQAFISGNYKTRKFYIIVGDLVQIPATDTAPEYHAYIYKSGNRVKACEADTGALFTLDGFEKMKNAKEFLMNPETSENVAARKKSEKYQQMIDFIDEIKSGKFNKTCMTEAIFGEDELKKSIAAEFIENIFAAKNQPETEPTPEPETEENTMKTKKKVAVKAVKTKKTVYSGETHSSEPTTTTTTTTQDAETTAKIDGLKKFAKGVKYSANNLTFDCTGVKTGFIRIQIAGEEKPRIMSVFAENNAEYIKYQSKKVTAYDICADDTPTGGVECPVIVQNSVAPETIPPQPETPSETNTGEKTGSTELLELPYTKSLKIFWNGLKINGDRCLTVKCQYCGGEDGKITIYARDYSGNLPADVFNIVNNSNYYTDYFDNDHATIDETHPLYKYFAYALDKQTEHDIKTYTRTFSGRDFEGLPNPGQPTAADLSAVAEMRIAAETRRNAEEQAEKQKQAEKINAEKISGQEFILKCAAMFPVVDGEPTVTIPFSECPAFYLWNDNFPDMQLSLRAAEMILKHFDESRHEKNAAEGHGGYYKTDFIINYTYQCEPGTYEGRYDLGDNDGGMIAHMMLIAEWHRTHEKYGKIIDNPPETTEQIDFVKWLSSFIYAEPETAQNSIVMHTNADSTADSGGQAHDKITVTFAPELQQAAEKHSENYAECEQILNDIDALVNDLPPEDIARIMDTLPHDTAGVLMARRICQQYAKTDPAQAAMLLGAWILDFNGGAQ